MIRKCMRRECDNELANLEFVGFCSWTCLLAQEIKDQRDIPESRKDFLSLRKYQPGTCSCGHLKNRHSRWPRSLAKKKSRQRGPLLPNGGGWRYQMNGCRDCECLKSFDWDVEEE